MTGLVANPGHVWGRPVGVGVAATAPSWQRRRLGHGVVELGVLTGLTAVLVVPIFVARHGWRRDA